MRGLGWGWGRSRYQLLSFLLPPLACLIVYGLVWSVGLGGFSTANIARVVDDVAHVTGLRLSLPLAIVVAQIIFFPVNFLFTLGEELGWRGLLAPELAKRYSYTGTALLSGITWAIYHYPGILFADYHSNTPLWYGLPIFTIAVMGVSFMATWLRLKSGSLWTGVFFHISHNMFVQSIFDRLTVDRGVTSYLTTEFGVGLAIVYGLLAFYFWRRRDEVEQVAAAKIQPQKAEQMFELSHQPR